MSAQCNRFVQNAWKKELCSNCFKPKEEHAGNEEIFKFNIGRASTNLKTDNHKSILRDKNVSQKDQKKKNVAFPESLTEIIGYGGDDFLSENEEEDEQDLVESLSPEDDAMVPDSEEERALGNLTRANTNFNTITANLTEVIPATDVTKPTPTSAHSKSFASLMLGKIQKDADGRKTTLLVSVTPFGGDEVLPTAKRPADRKITINGFSNQKSKFESVHSDNKSEIILKSAKKIDMDQKKEDKQDQKYPNSNLEKIADMPLITSNNLISVIQRNELNDPENSPNDSLQKSTDYSKSERKMAAISRSPAIKKPETEKPKLTLQSCQNGTKNEYEIVTRIVKRSENEEKGIELTLTPLGKNEMNEATESDRSIVRGKDVNKITVKAADNEKLTKEESTSLEIRKVEGEVDHSNERKFSFEESRELAGEPDGKADEEEVTEPPALPKSPPPIESRPPLQGDTGKASVITTEPRVSFLHGGVHPETKSKPVVPQKPMAFTAKPSLPKNPTVDNSSTKKTVMNSYVPPPPSVQNIVNRTIPSTDLRTKDQPSLSNPVQNKTENVLSSGLSHDISRSEPVPKEKEQQSSQSPRLQAKLNQSLESKPTLLDATNQNPLSLTSSNFKTKPPPLNLTRNHPSDGRDVEENFETEEDADVQPGSNSELVRSPNKRRMAPRPPGAESVDDLAPASSLFARNPGANLKSDSPVVREKEKRERASSCSPKFRKAVCEVPDPGNVNQPHEGPPRRTISLSQDSLTNTQEVREEKKRGRSRFSLKRFLRMGSRKDVDMISGHASGTRIDEIPSTPQPKPRLEIIHPLELDGAAVEVVGNDRINRISEDQPDSASSKHDLIRQTRSQPTGIPQQSPVRPGKPPPPPRNQSLEDWSRLDPANKPMRPPPPRMDSTKQLPPRTNEKSSKSTASWQPSSTATSTSDSIYANLAAEDVTGEVRSALAPSKPQRTASMRDQATSQPIVKKHTTTSQCQSQDYEGVINTSLPTSDSPTSNDSHVYECLSSSPECDSNLELRHAAASHLTCKRKSDSSAMEPAVEFKFHHQPFVRSTSLPYCGSETESELYAPYSFYTGDEGPEEDQDWKRKDDEFRLNRLRQRRGRSIVHRSLEDNYGAVVVANHEALAQFLEQLNQVAQIPSTLRPLKNSNPRLTDFNIDVNGSISVGKRIFCGATWAEQSVTLCIAFDPAMHVSRKEFYLAPIIEFIDTVPKEIAEKACVPENKDTEATISVFPRLQVNTIRSFGLTTKDAQDEGATREASFVLLQFVNALKSLQARGIEEAPRNLSNVVLCREDKDACYRLYLLQGWNLDTCDEKKASLCQCALAALQELFLASKLPLVQDLLMREKAVTLSQVKSVLEFSLWGPADVTLGNSRERELTLQRWLDLERATVLHALVRTRTPLTVTDEYQLLFLVRTSARIMCEASILLDEQRTRLTRIC